MSFQPSGQRAPRIFVAEDDPQILELVVTRLDLAGFETRFARNGWQAFEAIKLSRPNAVILDINMPGMDGFGVLRSMRGNKALAATPVMMLTARGALDDVKRALDGGANDYLTKPFDDQELILRVHRLVRPPRIMTPAPQAAGPPKPAGPDDALLI
jgi:DNA-binding response OmpR family regulator